MASDRLVIIGLDAADWNYIELHKRELPTFRRMIDEPAERGGVLGGRLENDIRPIVSGPSWSQLFAGTTFGLDNFARDQKRAEVVADPRWLWKGVEDSAFVAGVPASLPPIEVNADGRGWIATTLSVTADEMERSTWLRASQMHAPLRAPGVTLVVSVWAALDRAGHIFGMNAPQTLHQYQVVDQALDHLWHWIEPHHWLIVSDHGMTNDESYYDPSWFTKLMDGRNGRHTPDGIILTNMADPPEKLSEVYNWIQNGGTDDDEGLG